MAPDRTRYFRIEGRELVDQLARGVLDLEKGGAAAPELVARMLRHAHTLKGAARVVKQTRIAELTHEIEDELAPLREGAAALPRARIDAVLHLLDEISGLLSALEPPAESSRPPVAPAAEGSTRPVAPAPPRVDEALRSVRADVEEMDALVDGIGETHAQLGALRRGLDRLGRARDLAGLLLEQLRAAGVGVAASATAGELAQLLGTIDQGRTVAAQQLELELRQVKDAAERLRLVPVTMIFNVLERAARDAAGSLGRRVAFTARGGEARVDAGVLGVLQNALIQVVRNAVAHGIEPEAERVGAGKPAEGQVTLEVEARGSRLRLALTDDGRGVDLEAVRREAERRGVLPAGGAELGAEELIAILLTARISTASDVTAVAGRGIGLDVVRQAVEQLGGRISVHTLAGRGTTITLVVPMSVASLDGLLVEDGEQRGVLPLAAVRTTLRVAPRDVACAREGESILLAGQVVPFTPLGRALRLPRPSDGGGAAAFSAVIVESGGALAAIGVERLLGTSSVVFRALPPFTPADPIVAGASLDADGTPRLVLDAGVLVERARAARPVAEAEAPARLPVLVIDDSLTTRMLEQSILESAGYEVELAVSGEEGLEKVRRKRYALLLVDVEMPGKSGFEVVAELRADPALRDLPAILVTSRNAPEDRQRGADVGASAYVVKSDFDQNELLRLIARLVG